MIAPVAIAGILIMAILANQAYSSSVSSRSVKCKTTQAGVTTCKTKTKTTTPLPQVSKIVKTPQVSKTQTPTAVSNIVTRSPSGQPTGGNVAQGTQKSSITGNVAQGAANTGQGSSAKKPTELTLSATRNGPDKIEGGVTWVPSILSGRLTSGGSGVAGAMILFSCGGETCEFQKSFVHINDRTDSRGQYSTGVLTTHKEKITAGYPGSDMNEDHLNLKSSNQASTIVK